MKNLVLLILLCFTFISSQVSLISKKKEIQGKYISFKELKENLINTKVKKIEGYYFLVNAMQEMPIFSNRNYMIFDLKDNR